MKRFIALSCGLVLCVLTIQSTCLAAEEKTGFDKAWDYMTLYEDKDNAFIQKIAFVGRLQLDGAWVEPDDYDNWNDIAFRRARAGFKAGLFNDWTAHIEADFDLNNDLSGAYNKLTDAYIAYSPNKNLTIKVLKQSAGFTQGGATSSKRLLTLERNNLTNNLWFTKEYFNGLLAGGEFGDGFSYKASIFSSGGDPEWDFDTASWFTFWSVGYKMGETSLNFDYVYQDEDENANTRDFEQVVSVRAQHDLDQWGIWGDVAFGTGFEDMEQSDIWGFNIMPYYNITKNTQGVLQYTYLDSKGDNGLRLNRYENKAVGGKGDRYNEVYAGYNIFFYGHKFKWQTGVSWVDMSDNSGDGGEFEGWTLSTGLRLYW